MTKRLDDRRRLQEAIDLSRSCPPVTTAFSVGAIVVGRDGRELARGFSRESDARVHAEEAALAKLPGIDLREATLYTSMEPCSIRKSRLVTCTQLILAAGIRRVVLAMREPPIIVDCEGVEQLQAQGVEVVEMPELAEQVRHVNSSLFVLG